MAGFEVITEAHSPALALLVLKHLLNRFWVLGNHCEGDNVLRDLILVRELDEQLGLSSSHST